jgi:hypothetical protein
MRYLVSDAQYLMRALALEEETGHVQNSSSTHLNICAAYSSLKKYKVSFSTQKSTRCGSV